METRGFWTRKGMNEKMVLHVKLNNSSEMGEHKNHIKSGYINRRMNGCWAERV